MLEPIRYLDVCSGYSAFTQGAVGLGYECLGYSEIDAFPSALLGHHYGASRPRYMPDPAAEGVDAKESKSREEMAKRMALLPDHQFGNAVTNFGDFSQIREDDIRGPVHLLTGGTPCQSFSVAGKRLGLDDPRGNLTLEFLALAKRVRAEWLAWENVPGILSHDDGRTMGTFLWLLGQLGYGWAYRVLDAQYIRVDGCERAVPQRRRRVIVVAHLGDATGPAAVLFDRESLRGSPAPRRETGQGVAPTISARTKGGGGLGTDFDLDGGLIPAVHVPPIVPQAMPAKWSKGSSGPAGDEIANLVAHSLTANGFDGSEDGSGRGTPLVPVAINEPVAFSLRGREDGPQAEPAEPGLSPSLRTVGGGSSHAFVAQEWAVRRLTPVECERLMGLDDDFTNITYRGKPAADGPRYKALGNSQARNMMRWIAHGIRDVIEAQRNA